MLHDHKPINRKTTEQVKYTHLQVEIHNQYIRAVYIMHRYSSAINI